MALPGDFGLVSIKGGVGWLVRIGQFLNGDGFRRYEHAFIYLGDNQIMEAEPGGANISSLDEYVGRDVMWSTDLINLPDWVRTDLVEDAKKFEGAPYSFLDYLAIALYRLGIKYPGVAKRVKDSKHYICSQLVAQVYADNGIPLTEYPPYLVTPGKLYKHLEKLRGYSKLAKQVQIAGDNSISIQSSGDINIGSVSNTRQ